MYATFFSYSATPSSFTVSGVWCHKGLFYPEPSEIPIYCQAKQCFIHYRRLTRSGLYRLIKVGCKRHCQEQIDYLNLQFCCNTTKYCNSPFPGRIYLEDRKPLAAPSSPTIVFESAPITPTAIYGEFSKSSSTCTTIVNSC